MRLFGRIRYIYFLWDHWAHSDYFENGILLKLVLGVYTASQTTLLIQPHKLHCCKGRDLLKPVSEFCSLVCSLFLSFRFLLTFGLTQQMTN